MDKKLYQKATKNFNFDYVPFFQEISEHLVAYEDRQEELVQILKEVGVKNGLGDQDENGALDLKVMDPFSFFACFMKFNKDDKRQRMWTNLKNIWSLKYDVPTLTPGVPNEMAMSALFFSFSRDREKDDIQNLWNLFKASREDRITENIYAKALIRKTKPTKLSQGLFYTDPEKFFPINGPTRDLLSHLNITAANETWSDYEQTLTALWDKLEIPFPKLSHEAWLFSNKSPNSIFYTNRVPQHYAFKPGPDGKFNREAYEASEIFIGYKSLGFGDLTKLNTEKKIIAAAKKLNPARGVARAKALAQFRFAQNGDFVYVSNGLNVCYGFGVIRGEYHFNKNVDKYPHRRNIEWIHWDTYDYESESTAKGSELFGRRAFGKVTKYETILRAYTKRDPLLIDRLAELGVQFSNTDTASDTQTLPMPPLKMNTPLNQILYGPPGTGKTYRTIAEAVAIVENKNYDDVRAEDREDVQRRYQNYREQEQIAFVTFHQSLSYEDYVEGLKPKLDTEDAEESAEDLKYEIKKGIFKSLVEKAEGRYELREQRDENPVTALGLTGIDIDKATFYKFALGEMGEEDRDIYDYCIDHNCIAVGYGGEVDYSAADTRRKVQDLLFEDTGSKSGLQAVNYLRNEIKLGDIVLISAGNHHIRAVGIVTGEYEYLNPSPIRYRNFRAVKWLKRNINFPVSPIYSKQFTHGTVYALKQADLKEKLRSRHQSPLNHVLIIDEINRGNVSRIFGELITLLEPDKRLGCPEALTVTLPYSREPFGVPPNLYIVGTMNTADRSVVALDSALRRRFRFTEIGPDSGVIGQILEDTNVTVNGERFDLVEIMETINDRIAFLRDRDHLIGHSYFLKMKLAEDLAEQFATGIIPLLREYFYEDYGQLELILGSGFISAKKIKGNTLFPGKYNTEKPDFNGAIQYKINDFRQDPNGLAQALSILLFGQTEKS